jgi:hypothetical protein
MGRKCEKNWSEKGKENSEDLDVDGKILESVLGKWREMVWTGCIWLSGVSCEHGNEP